MLRSETAIRSLPARLNLASRLASALAEALARRRDRHALAQLDAHLLRDIGLAPEDARREAAKPFWRA